MLKFYDSFSNKITQEYTSYSFSIINSKTLYYGVQNYKSLVIDY